MKKGKKVKDEYRSDIQIDVDNPTQENVELKLDTQRIIEEKNIIEDKYLRLLAEFDNYKKRTESRINDIKNDNKISILSGLVNIVDDINLSKKMENQEGDSWVEGIEIIFGKISNYFVNMGILEVECSVGDRFDSSIHDCISVIENGDDNKGKICEIINKGYSLEGKIFRYPKVIVGK